MATTNAWMGSSSTSPLAAEGTLSSSISNTGPDGNSHAATPTTTALWAAATPITGETTTVTTTTTTTTIIVGLNAAYQKRFILSPQVPLIPGNVHRAQSIQRGIGGKGQDVIQTLSCLRYSGPVQLAQFIGSGPDGDFVLEQIRNCCFLFRHPACEGQERQGMGESRGRSSRSRTVGNTNGRGIQEPSSSSLPLTVRTQGEIRTCTSIAASDSTTELVEPSSIVTEGEQSELRERLLAFFPQTTQVGDQNEDVTLCFMGSLPPGCPPTTYADIYQIIMARRSISLCIIDSVVGLPELFQRISTVSATIPPSRGDGTQRQQQPSVVLLKINASELCRLAQITLPGSQQETMGVSRSNLISALRVVLTHQPHTARQAVHAIAITDGVHPAHLAICNTMREEFELFQSPVVVLSQTETTTSAPATNMFSAKALYPIGAGDAVAAGIVAAWNELVKWDGERREENVLYLPSEMQSMLRRCDQIGRDTDPMNSSTDSNMATNPAAALSTNESGSVENRVPRANTVPTVTAILQKALAFGLACGTASCLQEENSVLNRSDVQHLYQPDQYTLLGRYPLRSEATMNVT